MAVEQGKELVVYATDKGEVALSINVVRELFCREATDTEIVLFMNLCKFQGLNPFLREVYLIKYGNNPATIVTGKETFTKRAGRHAQFDGYDTGLDLGEDGLPVTARATVYRKDRGHPVHIEVDFDEYASRNKDGVLVKNWREKPKTMLRKVALVQALREAFPEDLGGLYDAAEITDVQVETVSGPEVPAGRPVQVGQPTPHAATPQRPQATPSGGNGGQKQPGGGERPQIKDPDAPATDKQIGLISKIWAKASGYDAPDLEGALRDALLTKGHASELIELVNAKDWNLKRFEDITGIEPVRPPEGEF